VTRGILAVLVCAVMSPSTAFATDWALNSTLTETVEANDNPFLRAVAGGAFDSYSTIAANAVALTPTSKFTFDGDVNYRKYWGPGVDGVQSESLSGDVRLHYETTGKDKTDRNYIDANWTRQSSAFALLGQLGFVTPTTGFIDSTTLGGGLERNITATDFVSLSARSTYTSFDPSGGGTPFTDSTGSTTWRHRLSSLTALTASSEIEWLDFDNTLKTNVLIWRENAGMEITLSPLLSYRGTAGVAYVQTERGIPALSLTPSAAGVSSSVSDFITDMLLTYKMYQDMTWTFTGTQTIAPTVIGSLSKQTTIGAGLSRNVNSRTTVTFSANVTRSIFSGTSTDYVSASVGYSYVLAREWNAQLTYRYLHRLPSLNSSASLVFDPVTGFPTPVSSVSGTGPASSNSIMLVVSRSVSVLPNGY